MVYRYGKSVSSVGLTGFCLVFFTSFDSSRARVCVLCQLVRVFLKRPCGDKLAGKKLKQASVNNNRTEIQLCSSS